MSKIIVGLDIGTTKIACFVGTRNEHGKVEILAMGHADSFGVNRGIVENIEKTILSIQDAVDKTQTCIQDKYELHIKSAYVGVAGQHVNSIQSRGMLTRSNIEHEISQADIDALYDDMHRTLMPPGEQIIDVIAKHFTIDGQHGIKDPKGHAGIRMEANFHIITGNVGACTNIVRCVSRAGLEAKSLILEPIASSEAVLSDEEIEAGVVLVDIGGGTTDIAIFHDGILQHTAIIPFGGNVITEDIKMGCSIMRNQAEKLKVKFGSAITNENQANNYVCIPGIRGRESKEISINNLAEIIKARMTEIIELVDYEIINSGFKNKLLGGIVITGGGANLKHVKQLFEYVTGIDTRIGLPNEKLVNTNEFKDLTSPIYATGIGLVLKGFKDLDRVESLNNTNSIKSSAKNSKTSEKRRNGFFETLLAKGKELFLDEE